MIKFRRIDLVLHRVYFERSLGSVFGLPAPGKWSRSISHEILNEKRKKAESNEKKKEKCSRGHPKGETRSERGAKRQEPYKNGSRRACTSELSQRKE